VSLTGATAQSSRYLPPISFPSAITAAQTDVAAAWETSFSCGGERYLDYIPAALQLPTSREVAAHIVYKAVDLNTRYPDHTGCLGINGALAGSDDAEPVRRALVEFRAAGQDRLRERFERAKAEGDLPKSAKPDVLAAFVMTVTQGIAVQAKAGMSRAMLDAVAERALSIWPATNSSSRQIGHRRPRRASRE
jgi:hypothetical protein